MGEQERKAVVLIRRQRETFGELIELVPAEPELEQYIQVCLKEGEQVAPLAVFDGEVEEIYPPCYGEKTSWARIIFSKDKGSCEPPGILIPLKVLEEADADFELAQIRYCAYQLGGSFFAIIQRIGPSDEELFKQSFKSVISDEDIEELDRLFAEQESEK